MKSLIISLSLVFLTSCASKPSGTIAVRPLPAANMPEEKALSIRYPEASRAYQIGRYVDPNNPFVMHETHTLYRVEETSRWNLHPGPQCDPLPVQLKTLSHAALVPTPFNEEVIAELNRQKEITQKVTSEADRLTAVLQQLGASLAESKGVAKENLTLKQQVISAEQRISALEIELRRQQQTTAAGASNAIFSTAP